MLRLQRRTLQILDRSQEGDRLSMLCDVFITAIIVLNVMAITLESYALLHEHYGQWFAAFEFFSVVIFSCEYALRLWSSGARYPLNAWRGRREYALGFHGVVDILAIAPFYLQAFFPGVDLRFLRILRLIRLLKISHYSSALEDLVEAIRSERRSLGATLYILFIALMLSSALMYYAEGETQPEKLSSIPHAMYWSVITLTTVGYGDISPVTTVGKIVSAVTALLGVSTLAILAGILASSFAAQIARRRAIFEQQMRAAYSDGHLSKDEAEALARLQQHFDLSDDLVAEIRNKVRSGATRKSD